MAQMGEWEWELSYQDSDSKQHTYFCLGVWPDGTPSGVPRATDIPYEGRETLAARLGLHTYDFKTWATVTQCAKHLAGLLVYISVERIWLTRGYWNWRKSMDTFEEGTVVFESYYGEELDAETLAKFRAKSYSLQDIGESGRRTLGREVELDYGDFNDWAKEVKIEEQNDSFRLQVFVSSCWMHSSSTDDWEWREDGYNADKSLKYYCCGGRAISEWLFSYIGNSCARSLVPSYAWEGLASKVGLLASEASEWAQDFSFTASNAGLKVRVAVPNVWICADLLRGGSLYDKTVYGTAGAVGQAPSRFFYV